MQSKKLLNIKLYLKKTSIIFLLLLSLKAYSQTTINQSALKQTLKEDASKMGAAFLAGDYKTFAKYTYPRIVEIMGGATNMAEALTKTTANMKAQGVSFSKITFDEPSAIVKSGSELQATIPQHIELKLTQGRLVNTSTLIAISTDNGKNWTFVDTSNKDMATLHKALPNLNSSITIPPPQQPVRYNN